MFNSQITKELTIVAENEIGVLGNVLDVLHEQGIQVQSIVGRILDGQAYFHVVSHDICDAQDALLSSPLTSHWIRSIDLHEVISLTADQELTVPMVRFTSLLAEQGVDVDYCYPGTISNQPVFIVATRDNEAALELWNKVAVAV